LLRTRWQQAIQRPAQDLIKRGDISPSLKEPRDVLIIPQEPLTEVTAISPPAESRRNHLRATF
jgi:hypothetical protein